MAVNPVFLLPGGWYFQMPNDDLHGPFDSEEKAWEKLREFVHPKSKHTPGPWKAKTTHPSHVKDGVLYLHWEEPKSVVSVWREYLDEEGRQCHRPVATVHFIGSPTEEALAEQLANANLIAAAPDLLAACKAQHETIDRLLARVILLDSTFLPSKAGQPWEALLQGNEAIAKAEGK